VFGTGARIARRSGVWSPEHGPHPCLLLANGLLDDVNKAIVEQLQKDGRRTYGAIAERSVSSEAAVRQRVQRMREAGIMQIVAVTDPLQVGFHSQAIGRDPLPTETLGSWPNASRRWRTSTTWCCAPDSFDILVELVCEDEDAILELLNGVIRQIPGYGTPRHS